MEENNNEIRIVLNESTFTNLVKKGTISDGTNLIQFTNRDMIELCKGKIVEKEIILWTGNIEYKILLQQDISNENINEILKRSPIFSDLAGSFN
jgi:hypothetical protein